MPIENLEEEGLEKNPKLDLAQMKFLLSLPENFNNQELKTKLMSEIKSENMAPFYELVANDLSWPIDPKLLGEMKAINAKKIEELDAIIEDAEKNLGEMEVREANLKKSEYLCRIGDKEAALSAFRKTYEKTVSLGHRLDIIFHNMYDHFSITR